MLVIRCLDPIGSEDSARLDFQFDGFTGEVPHKEWKFSIARTDITGLGRSRAGNIAEDVLFDLHTSYEFKIDEQRVAKALLSYYNSEMTEFAPTFESIKVASKYKGQGIGTAVVKKIEKITRAMGFDRIWATDAMDSLDFWKKMGYETDIDECVKYL